MGHETKLLIGVAASTAHDEHELGDPELDGDGVYRPMLKDGKGNFICTGRKQTYFFIYATVDLCKCGYESNIHKIDKINKDESHCWYWYNGGGQEVKKDCYDEELKPVPIEIIIDALEKDAANDDYRRFKWALALLKAMKNDGEDKMTVLLYGH